ncbi:hypothetical protein GALMADRAFT_783474 [Galerina marginata CBS 339.88]|uniref:Uncharacterized protein n=1 Tax=Galerina marginata (strain CBS 339.88) TaxID=685588 RepID=A0A067SYM6_GALM3|nr:hypothetical protein GALMADRAFT_783474 [Galerina marginata CBS 339.88]
MSQVLQQLQQETAMKYNQSDYILQRLNQDPSLRPPYTGDTSNLTVHIGNSKAARPGVYRGEYQPGLAFGKLRVVFSCEGNRQTGLWTLEVRFVFRRGEDMSHVIEIITQCPQGDLKHIFFGGYKWQRETHKCSTFRLNSTLKVRKWMVRTHKRGIHSLFWRKIMVVQQRMTF